MSDSDHNHVDQYLELNQATLYIAKGTRQIVDTIRELDNDNSSNFEENVKILSNKSNIEKEELVQKFDEERKRIKQRFNQKYGRT